MKIGKLVSIDYSQLKVKISSEIRGGSVNFLGNVYYFGNIGSYLKTTNAVDEVIVCEVMSILDSDVHQEKHSFDIESNRELLIKPIGTINKKDEFTLGVGVFPSLYSDVSIITYDDMKLILRTNNKSQTLPKKNEVIHQSFSLGLSKNLINYPIDINIDDFFNMHSAVLGNSGSGKSNTIAHILQEIHSKRGHSATGARFVIFDVNGEYKAAFKENTNEDISIKYYRPNVKQGHGEYEPFCLPHFLMSLDEWSAFLLATEATQRPFWNNVLQESYRFYSIGEADGDSKDEFINYLRYRVCSLLQSALRQGDSATARITTAASILGAITSIIHSDPKIRDASHDLVKDIEALEKVCTVSFGVENDMLKGALDKIATKIDLKQVAKVKERTIGNGQFFDYKFLKIAAEMILLEEDARGNKQIRGYTATMLTRLDYFIENADCGFMRHSNSIKSTEEYLNNFWGTGTDKYQLVIIDTSELSPDILETMTSVVSRLFFDSRKKLVGDKRRQNPIHLILDEAHRYIKKNHNYILKENIFEKIAREGRKYSLYLLVSSQRPSELSETVLSQCANFIIHRIQNERDMHYIQAILPYFSDDFTSKIKQSTPGEALVFGNCVSMPLHLKIHPAAPGPSSKNCNIPEEWFKKYK